VKISFIKMIPAEQTEQEYRTSWIALDDCFCRGVGHLGQRPGIKFPRSHGYSLVAFQPIHLTVHRQPDASLGPLQILTVLMHRNPPVVDEEYLGSVKNQQ
jgi:hypothetical protein